MKRSIILTGLAILFIALLSNDLQAQEDKKQIPKYGEDSVKTLTKLSLYREFYDQWKKDGFKGNAIHDALKSWRWLFDNAPRSSQNMYIHGSKMYRYLIKKAKDEEHKEGLLDTLMSVYDKRLTYFPTNSKGKSQEGKILGFKGVDMYQFAPDRVNEVYDILKRSVSLRKENSQSAVLVYYFRTTIQKYKNGDAEKALIVDVYDKISDIIDANLKKYADNKRYRSMWENVQGNIEDSFEPYASCEDLTRIYSVKFEESPEDTELLEKITQILDKKDCDDTDLFFEVTEKLHELQPTAESAKKMGRMLLAEENYDEAIKYLKESAELFDDDVEKADAFKILANIYSMEERFETAREYAYKSLELIPKDGKLYIMIGDMYASSADQCGSNDLTSKVAYWAAVDKYEKAKQIDSTVADEANERIDTYKKHFPRKETIFFHDLEIGDSYEVECWINETTTVRSSD
ncbi:MAG: tetratricopeptide repeat protein [Bacteroidota bacterium]